MEEALVKREDIQPDKRDDWNEVQNYITAINYSIQELEKLPISTRLIKNTHQILLAGVRGKNKLPGEFRTSQNWIGATLKDAVFIPPHFTQIPDLMGDLEKFIHNENIKVPHLIKIAIIHYQFETIHPFLDGNGRLGRLLVTLILVSTGLLKKPALYLSDFFEKNKNYYYDNLMAARLSNNLTQWIKFFLVGIIETSKSSIGVFKSIIELRRQVETEKLPRLGKKIENGYVLLNLLYQKPIVESKEISEFVKISPATANRLIVQFTEMGILSELTGYKRNRKFIFKDYFEIFQSK
jgi:Fic family protein